VMGTAIAGGIAAAIVMPRIVQDPVARDERARGPRTVDTVIVQAAPSTINLALDGTAAPIASQQLHARAAGVVESVTASLGDRVTRGQPLATVSVRVPATADMPTIGATDTLLAPFDGLITRRNVEVGAKVTDSSGPLFEISDVGILKVYVDVPQTLAPWVKVGESVAVTARAVSFATITGHVARTAGALDAQTHTLRLEVQMPGERLLAGSAVTVRFAVKREVTPPMIPARALVFGNKWPRVVRIVDGRARYSTVELGWDRGGDVEIAGGLEVGDVVAVSAPDNIREGEPLVLQETKTTAAR
ncbi:MAG TPA: efflux RND transporter periplasmic adaptor subunit, partial [Myxococcota bacterium]|nr:efflux RND transporter periplasmic adaptor subunit [Myxococcota bacterium]